MPVLFYGAAFMHGCLTRVATTQSGHDASMPSLIYLETTLTLALLMIKYVASCSFYWKIVVKILFHFSLYICEGNTVLQKLGNGNLSMIPPYCSSTNIIFRSDYYGEFFFRYQWCKPYQIA